MNIAAFAWGRAAAIDRDSVAARVADRLPKPAEETPDLDALITRFRDDLVGYQSRRYAARYTRLVDSVRAAEARTRPDSTALTEAVARNFHKLMAYKDEYEVARLYARPEFRKDLEARFGGEYQVHVHLAPPLLAKRDKATGHLVKQEFGPWMLKAFGTLAKFRKLRGTPLDPFGRTAERRAERALIDRYEASIQKAVGRLSDANFDDALALAGLPARIRGFGHVKEAAMRAVEPEWQRLDAAIASGSSPDDRGRAPREMEIAAE